MQQSSPHFSSNPSLQIPSMRVSSRLPVASIPSFDKDGLTPQASLNRLQQIISVLDSSLRLPSTPRAFMIYLVGLAIVFAGAFLHVLVAAQIMQAEFTLLQLQEEYRAIEQQNGDIIFQIARDTNMARLQERVLAEGYVPVQTREYVFAPSESLAAVEMADDSTQANTNDRAATATQGATALPTSSTATSNWRGGQLAQWEAFWNSTWRSADDAPSGIIGSRLQATNLAASSTTADSAADGWWTTWWEQATAQGSKLLDQFRGQ